MITKFNVFESSHDGIEQRCARAMKTIADGVRAAFVPGTELGDGMQLSEMEANDHTASDIRTLNFSFGDGATEYTCIVSMDVESASAGEVDSVKVTMKRYTDRTTPEEVTREGAPDDFTADFIMSMMGEVGQEQKPEGPEEEPVDNADPDMNQEVDSDTDPSETIEEEPVN